MQHTHYRLWVGVLLACLAVATLALPAHAGVRVSLGIGFPVYPPVVVYPAPVIVTRPPVVVAPPPVVYGSPRVLVGGYDGPRHRHWRHHHHRHRWELY
jgi:hypothetical protein